ncbi:MAG TPA: MG2 domain-containing protein [Bauldia sp.]|nr:MG2 domain-containing protein [Bauldia sp.]
MRVLHALHRLIFPVVFIAVSAVIAGNAAAADRRVIMTSDADYSGFDLRTVKNIPLDVCEQQCTDDNQCRAFTYNTKASWCFLKSDFGELSASKGNTAGRVVDAVIFTPTIEKQRLGELTFIDQSLIDEARTQVGDLKTRYNTTGASYADQRKAGGVAFRTQSYDAAASAFGEALALAPEDPGAWLDYAVASLARNPENYSDRDRAQIDASGAAINAYLRAESKPDRAEALGLLGDALAKREIWLPSIRAYRASLALNKVQRVQDAYDKVVAEHGFRVVDNTVEADSPTPQICVKFSDSLPVDRPDLADFVTVDGGDGLSVEPQDQQICVNGVKHGGRYTVRLRGELPAKDGETLGHPVELSIYVRDRSPWVGFAGNAYVLPGGPGASIPLTSVNTDKAKITIYRIPDRGLVDVVRNGNFLSQLSKYSADDIGYTSGEKVWDGTLDIKSELNQNQVTGIPVADAVPAMRPGVYVITAAPSTGDSDDYGPVATQWFIVSDMGLTALSGDDGIHVVARSLTTAQALPGVGLQLLAVNNEILGLATTDADGVAVFDAGLARGTGGNAPQLVLAGTPTGSDFAFLDLTRAAFDLTDRGVDGRPAPQKLDVFLTPERGIYRPGETIHMTGIVRDTRANAVGDLPLTLIVERPDGVEYKRDTLSDKGLGGYNDDIALQDNAMRGSWTAKLYADVKDSPLAETTVLVEDFEPERLALTVDTDAKVYDRNGPTSINLEARYLYGASAPDLTVEGEVVLTPTNTVAAFPGYKFGLAEESVEPTRDTLSIDATTDEDGKATFDMTLPDLQTSTRPYDANVILRVADTNGRAVERTLSRPVSASGPLIGIKPAFDGDVEEGAQAIFDTILVSPDGQRLSKPGATWKLERIESDYQWYRTNGNWNYELITTASKVDGGTLDFSADAPTRITSSVKWGDYRLTVSDGDETASSIEFYAGWYRAVASSDTPDTLQVALDKPAYQIGDTAKLRLDPRFAGTALIQVIDDRLIAMKTVDVPEGGTTVDLQITEDWGPGAYVTATLYRPMDVEAKRMPARALGLTWAKVAPGDRQLDVSLDVPDELRPRGPMTIPLSISNLKPGEEAYVTIAAVDVGILNLTNFKAPAPDDWYFGQRKLGMEIRDLYGLLIDGMQGVPGVIRSGGDSEAVRLKAPPPTQKLLAFYSGILQVDDQGKASVTFDVPDFNGSVRIMAMAWSKTGVGHASKDVFVRDPVVVTASIPRFLAVGDTSRLLVEVNNVSGPAGDYTLTVATGEGIGFKDDDATRNVTLAEKQRVAFNIPISGDKAGDFDINVSLTSPAGETFPANLVLGVRPPGAPVTRRTVVSVAGGGSLTIDKELLSEFVPGTTSVAVSLGGAGPLDVAGILSALDRYPYGCVEQLTSRAMPLVYLDDVAASVGIAADAEVRKRVQDAVVRVLADQAASGSFGLWGPEGAGNDLWLDAYVTDFLTRATEKGYDVPAVARNLALDNLSNRIAYANDFDSGGEDIAYSLYVLARAGRAAIGDLRYYTDSKLSAFSTPLAKAQIGAAMALYGDRQRAGRAFTAAMGDIYKQEQKPFWRRDYGTILRDQAAVLTLAAETREDSVDIRTLATRIAATEMKKTYTSTQENSWMLLAAAALIKDSAKTDFSIDGQRIAAPLFRRFSGDRVESSPVEIDNLGSDKLDAIVAATGVPETPDPEGGNGFKIERTYYTPDGEEADVSTVKQNDRFIVELTVTSDHDFGGHLMITDPIPAGFEIENPDISTGGSVSSYDWLSTTTAAHTEARTDRFIAAVDRDDDSSTEITVAYSVRAVSPGVFAQPAATVEDMYRPEYQARSGNGTVEVVGPTR